jgi:hypothetical protein
MEYLPSLGDHDSCGGLTKYFLTPGSVAGETEAIKLFNSS